MVAVKANLVAKVTARKMPTCSHITSSIFVRWEVGKRIASRIERRTRLVVAVLATIEAFANGHSRYVSQEV